jgi:hypothetical protein
MYIAVAAAVVIATVVTSGIVIVRDHGGYGGKGRNTSAPWHISGLYYKELIRSWLLAVSQGGAEINTLLPLTSTQAIYQRGTISHLASHSKLPYV